MSSVIQPVSHLLPVKRAWDRKCEDHAPHGQEKSARDQEIFLPQGSVIGPDLLYDLGTIIAEDIHRYKDGILPVVHLGYSFENRYCFVMNVGHGYYSTVWLATDDLTR